MLQDDMRPDAAIPWSPGRLLAWNDFAGTPPQPDTREAARTTTVLYYAWRCRGAATSSFEFAAIAGFVPRDSWVRPGIPADTANAARVLRHEQTHFDLAEVYARRMRQRLETVSHPCARTNAELESVAGQLVRDEADAQRRYDAETDHSLVVARQAEWEQQVANDLASLSRYAGRVIHGNPDR
ncbi:MAG TPA: DUF922 domain-containing protein [Gemmatimonadales bacterium]|nr:DUF922 domain-containing protein [Gemmatimonadales bacterium]